MSEAGTGEFGTLMSEGGRFTDIDLEHADWIVDPGLLDYPDMIHISGYYESGEDEYTYDIYLRPWGTYWDDVTEEDLPYYYYDWYLPLIEPFAQWYGVMSFERSRYEQDIKTSDCVSSDTGSDAVSLCLCTNGATVGRNRRAKYKR